MSESFNFPRAADIQKEIHPNVREAINLLLAASLPVHEHMTRAGRGSAACDTCKKIKDLRDRARALLQKEGLI